MDRVAFRFQRRGSIELLLLLSLLGIASSANAQLSGRFRSAPATMAAYQYQADGIQTVMLPADIVVSFSGAASNATLSATIRQPIIGDTQGVFAYPIVHNFPMDVTATSSDGKIFRGNLLDTQYLFDWEFQPSVGDQLQWSGRVYWAGGRFELSTITNAQLIPVKPGDYNADGVVDAADYISWRTSDGTPANYETWRNHFGIQDASGMNTAFGPTGIAEVPEPRTLGLWIVAAILGICGLRYAQAVRHRQSQPANYLAESLEMTLEFHSREDRSHPPVRLPSPLFVPDFFDEFAGFRLIQWISQISRFFA